MVPVGGRTQPHEVCVPYPSQGHWQPLLALALDLALMGGDALMGLPGFRFEAIPDGLPQSDTDATQDVPALSDSIRKNCLGPFKELLVKLGELSEMPPVTCIISDGVTGFGSRAAVEVSIPEVQFWSIGYFTFFPKCLAYAPLFFTSIILFWF
ncbi:hypothetical protein PRUPE_6G190000 [Prunus persica]|uniref:Uncharacterized protein n=1 Tax=Prunus persica TaxID=3760 RepID=M5WN52_PRUPE|nr:hypothetical protein PRUPE_6G190000 [Prunus persica]